MKSLHKKIIVTTSAILCVTACVAAVNANNISSIFNDETTEISAALESSPMLENMYGDDVINENENMGKATAQLRIASINKNDKPDYAEDETIQLFHVESTSLYDNAYTDYQYVVPVKKSDNIVAVATLNKGKRAQDLQAGIEALNVPDSEKTKILKVAEAREGKWYVSSLREVPEDDKTVFVFDMNAVNDYLKERNITNVKDYRYVYVDDIGASVLVIISDLGEYVIPFNLTAVEESEANIYTVSDYLSMKDVKCGE